MEFEHNIKLDNQIITELLKNNEKRALFIYVYALRWSSERPFLTVQISTILDFLEKKAVASNIATVKKSLNLLINLNLISIFSDKLLRNIANIDELSKNHNFYMVAKESLSESDYTLVNSKYIDKTMFNDAPHEKEDMLSIVLLLSRNIERREDVLQITWHSTDKLAKELKIRKERFLKLIESLKKLEIIYFDKLTLRFENEKEKNHLIYSMFDRSEDVVQAIIVALKNKKLDKRVKLLDEPINISKDGDPLELLLDEETGEEFYGPSAASYEAIYERLIFRYEFGRKYAHTEYDINSRSVEVVNQVFHEYGRDITLNALDEIGSKLDGVDNPTGYMIKTLKKIAENIVNQSVY